MTRNILFINEFYHPDICASAAVLADRLPRIVRMRPDFKITVIAGNRAWNDPSVFYPKTDEHEGVRIVRVDRPVLSRRNLFRRAMGFVGFQRSAVRAARELDKVDLVIGTTAPPNGGRIARTISKFHRCPYIYTVLDLYPDLAATLGKMSEGSFLYRRWLKLDTKVMRDAVRVVAIAEKITERIARTRTIDVEKLLAIHDGFDPARIELTGSENSFRREHIPNSKFVVQYAGNMGLSHPFEMIMSACKALADRNDILFQFIGDGPQRPYIQENLPSNGRLIDYQPAERLGEVLDAADLCLISQHPEMFDKALPYKVYGIFAASKPAVFIGGGQSEIANWLAVHRAGVHIEPDDENTLLSFIRAMKDDPVQTRSMGESGRRLLDEKLHAQMAAERWTALLEQVLS